MNEIKELGTIEDLAYFIDKHEKALKRNDGSAEKINKQLELLVNDFNLSDYATALLRIKDNEINALKQELSNLKAEKA